MRNPDDPYKTLGLSPDATLREVRAAYESSLLKCYGEYSRGDLEAVRERLRALHEAYVAVLMTAASSQRSDRGPLDSPDLALIELARLEARAVQGDGAEERVLGERSLPPLVGAEAPGSPIAEERSPETRPGEQAGVGVEQRNLTEPNSAKRRVRHPFQSYSDDERKSRSSSRQSRPIGWASSRI
jgi:hypothetical protein